MKVLTETTIYLETPDEVINFVDSYGTLRQIKVIKQCIDGTRPAIYAGKVQKSGHVTQATIYYGGLSTYVMGQVERLINDNLGICI